MYCSIHRRLHQIGHAGFAEITLIARVERSGVLADQRAVHVEERRPLGHGSIILDPGPSQSPIPRQRSRVVGIAASMRPLPIDPLLAEITAVVRARGQLVLEAPPGAGKTTRVPFALSDALGHAGQVLVTEPRRLAARLAAKRVADERGLRLGDAVGYSVRFEEVGGPNTRLSYVTEGVLIRRLLGDPMLRGVSAVVLDEVHERHLDTDLLLALLSRLRRERRPDLALIVMSATLDAEPFARFLGDAPRLRSEGRAFPISVEHLPQIDERPLEKQVASAVRRLTDEEPTGDILVFLPGAAEIRRAGEALATLARNALYSCFRSTGTCDRGAVRAVELPKPAKWCFRPTWRNLRSRSRAWSRSSILGSRA